MIPILQISKLRLEKSCEGEESGLDYWNAATPASSSGHSLSLCSERRYHPTSGSAEDLSQGLYFSSHPLGVRGYQECLTETKHSKTIHPSLLA